MGSSRRSRMVVMGLGLGAVALVFIYLVLNRPQSPNPATGAMGEMTAANAATSPLTAQITGENDGLLATSPLTSESTSVHDSTQYDSVQDDSTQIAVGGATGNYSATDAAATVSVTVTSTPSATATTALSAESASSITRSSTTSSTATISPTATETPTVSGVLMPMLPAGAPATTPSSTPTPAPTPTPTRAPPAVDEAVDVPIYDYTVVAVYPHDPEAFTQGLQYVDGVFYEGTGLRGQSSLRRVAPETGEVLQRIELPDHYFGEGITVVDERLYQLTWESRTGFVYDRSTFEQIDEFQYATEGWGLTYDGEHLIMSDGTANLYHRDPETFEEVDRVTVKTGDVTVPQLNELEYIEGEVFANVWRTDWIARIDPATGDVVGWLDMAGLLNQVNVTGPVDVLNGIAYDGKEDRIFVTGKWWPALFEIVTAPR